MDIALMPVRRERLQVLAVRCEGRWPSGPASAAGSARRCRHRVCRPARRRAAQASARLTATVDLPTPPLPLATATMFLTPRDGLERPLHRMCDDIGRELERHSALSDPGARQVLLQGRRSSSR